MLMIPCRSPFSCTDRLNYRLHSVSYLTYVGCSCCAYDKYIMYFDLVWTESITKINMLLPITKLI